jgi:hypothetical protein
MESGHCNLSRGENWHQGEWGLFPVLPPLPSVRLGEAGLRDGENFGLRPEAKRGTACSVGEGKGARGNLRARFF